ncbi:MAG TPA: PEGA domain-containing protein, partial [Kofleriaceae bacterium]|nr:PEGA domain-containing protein [Kofleriaceae bacterium]
SGTVRIHSEPWAYVTVAGRRVETPATLTLPPGDHQLSLYSPDLDRRRTVWATVRPGKTKTIRVRFER